MGLVVDEIQVDGLTTTIAVDPIGVQMETPGNLVAHVAALDLASFLDLKSPGGLRDFAVAIREGNVYVEATARVIVEMRAKVTCTLRIEEGKRLFVDLQSVDVLGMGGMKNLVQGHLDQINPVLDVEDLPLAVVLDEVIADHDRITLKGKAGPR